LTIDINYLIVKSCQKELISQRRKNGLALTDFLSEAKVLGAEQYYGGEELRGENG